MNSEEDSRQPTATPGESSGAVREPAFVLRLAQRAGINRAVAYAVMARLWQLFTGPVTQLLIVVWFSLSTQDYYFAFSSMLGMQVFVELGLHVVLINLASREWAHLTFVNGKVSGDPQALARLVDLGRMMLKWYVTVAVIFALALIILGMYYFRDIDQRRLAEHITYEAVGWIAPWCCLVLLTGLQLSLLPMTAMLEGCHQLGPVNRVRFWQGVVGSFVVWATISSGFGLWALVGSAAVRTLGELYLVFGEFRRFFVTFRRPQPSGIGLNWRSEILPLQWRMAVQGAVAWGANQMPVLVILHFHPTTGEAGRLGMTWTILTALQSASMALVDSRRPQFGSLIAKREFGELDHLFFRMARNSILLLAAALISFSIAIVWIGSRNEWLFERLAGRMLPVLPTMIFSAAFLGFQFVMCFGIYVRAHCRDPFLAMSVVSCLTIAVLQLILGRSYGSSGLAVGYAIGVLGIQLPVATLIWRWARRHWHMPVDSPPAQP